MMYINITSLGRHQIEKYFYMTVQYAVWMNE